MEIGADIYQHFSGSFGAKKWISATAVADLGNAQAIALAPVRRYLITFRICALYLLNRSGSTVVMGIGVRYATSTWAAGQVTAAGVYTDDTTDAQSATAADFPLHTRTDSGSGFLLSADERFNIVALIQSAAGDQTTPTQVIEYWNGAAWTDLAATCFINDALDANSTGEKIICFPMPFDWVVGGSGTGVPASRYNLRIRQTTGGAGSANPVATQVFIGFVKALIPGLVDGNFGGLIREHPLTYPASGDALFPLSSVASANNYLEVDVQWCAPAGHP